MLGVEMHITIKTLFEKGYNKTQIANMLSIDRKTVRKVLKEIEINGNVERRKKATLIDQYKEYIEIQAAKELSAKRIYQDMVRDFGYKNSYDTVKRYVAKIRYSTPKAYMVLNALPGEEAQVDFGYIGTLKLSNNKRKKAWVFVMTISYSRYMYAQIVLDQSVATFIDCHKNAFRYFGGIPQTVKIDNLKAAILEADFYEPTVQRSYAAFALHYGFSAEPCRVRTPTDKGKVESNVKYIKDNCFKKREFESLNVAKIFLKQWLKEIANNRIHGTTKKVPSEVFKSIEKEKLKAIPTEDYNISDFSKCTVMTNCHISYKGNYYSVPYIYIGEHVDVIVSNNLLKVFKNNIEIALHPLIKDEKGLYMTNKSHYPKSKNITNEDIKSTYKEQMSEIGANALKFFEEFIKQPQNKYSYRPIGGIIALRKKYNDQTINAACLRAYTYGALKYKVVKNICEKGLEDIPLNTNISYINESETDMFRPLSEYSKLLNLMQEVELM